MLESTNVRETLWLEESCFEFSDRLGSSLLIAPSSSHRAGVLDAHSSGVTERLHLQSAFTS
jgi:hypothetical protein